MIFGSTPSPSPTLSSLGSTGDTQKDRERERQLDDCRGGWVMSRIIRQRESLDLHKFFNTLCCVTLAGERGDTSYSIKNSTVGLNCCQWYQDLPIYFISKICFHALSPTSVADPYVFEPPGSIYHPAKIVRKP